MKKGFDWQTDIEDEAWEEQEQQSLSHRRWLNPIWLAMLVAIVGIVSFGGWLSEQQVEESDEALRQLVQDVLDREHQAFLNGDGELYFSMLADDPAWRAAQLRPENMMAARAGYTVTAAELHGDIVWADVVWEENGYIDTTQHNRLFQRIIFFERQNGQLVHIATDADYWGNWGEMVSRRYDWGELTYTAKDEPFVDEIAKTIAGLIAEICAVDCVAEQLPFHVAVMPDFSQTAKAHTIHIPSPRLLGLDENGEINGRFQEQLRQLILDRLSPVTIHFALPPVEKLVNQHLLDYEQAAVDFMAANPHITIELIPYDTLPADMSILAGFDGAAIPPTADMIAAGLVRDLTDFASSDPTFYPTDFYEKGWQAAVWQDRLWFVPQSSDLRLLYYDKAAYERAERPEPSWQWSWTTMEADVETAVFAQPSESAMDWGYLDTGRDSLFAYAFSESNRCQATCPQGLQPEQVEAALTWYARMVHENRMIDVSGMDATERDQLLLNMQSAERSAVIWVDKPVLYEYHFLLDPIGAAPFPGQDLFVGSTPLWVDGSFISAKSKRPFATWQWLVFLSKQTPASGFRRIPARPSIAADTNFWERLPRDLANPMRAAFNNARPVTIEDQLYFSLEEVTTVVDGEKTAVEAARTKPHIDWFSNGNE